jgi:hypothetical protein
MSFTVVVSEGEIDGEPDSKESIISNNYKVGDERNCIYMTDDGAKSFAGEVVFVTEVNADSKREAMDYGLKLYEHKKEDEEKEVTLFDFEGDAQ